MSMCEDSAFIDISWISKMKQEVVSLRAKNALLLKALQDVRPSCRAAGCWCPESLGYDPGRKHSAACDAAAAAAAAALARIPEAKPHE